MLINTVANTGLTAPLLVLSFTLLGLLLPASLFQAMRIHMLDRFRQLLSAQRQVQVARAIVLIEEQRLQPSSPLNVVPT